MEEENKERGKKKRVEGGIIKRRLTKETVSRRIMKSLKMFFIRN